MSCRVVGGQSHSTAPEMKSDTTASMRPLAGDQMPVWPVARSRQAGRARISRSSAGPYILPQECRYGERPLAGALCPARREGAGRVADAVQASTLRRRRRRSPARHRGVCAGPRRRPCRPDRLDDVGHPVRRQHAAGIGDADQQGARAGRGTGLDRELGQGDIGLAPGQAELADAGFGAPVDDALGGLGGELVGDGAEEEEIGRFDHGQASRRRSALRGSVAGVRKRGETARARRLAPFGLS